MPTKDFFLWTTLSFMTHRAQPLAAVSIEETIEFLNTAAASWISVFQQKE